MMTCQCGWLCVVLYVAAKLNGGGIGGIVVAIVGILTLISCCIRLRSAKERKRQEAIAAAAAAQAAANANANGGGQTVTMVLQPGYAGQPVQGYPPQPGYYPQQPGPGFPQQYYYQGQAPPPHSGPGAASGPFSVAEPYAALAAAPVTTKSLDANGSGAPTASGTVQTL